MGEREERADGGFEVEAAGGVIWRPGDDGVEVVVVHRPRYDDWTFPKGKLDPGETHEQAAVREVEEETGLRCRLGDEIAAVTYRDHQGRAKRVRYWAMVVEDGEFAPNAEVDQLRWLPISEAVAALTYGHDRRVLGAFTRS